MPARRSHRILTALVIIATATAASAESYNGRYVDIQIERDRQQTAINNGRTDGSLTWFERYSLKREQARIEQLEREALADGRLNREEYRQIRQSQGDAAQHIARERHDGDVRGWWWRLWR